MTRVSGIFSNHVKHEVDATVHNTDVAVYIEVNAQEWCKRLE